jgi:predicted P-loop ATPase
MDQVWGEANNLWERGNNYWLTREEEVIRETQSLEFRAISSAEETIENYLTTASYPVRALNRSEFLEMLNLTRDKATMSTAGRLLEKHLGPKRKIGGKQNCWPIPCAAEDDPSIS